jgi:nicotinamide phosphoribosyltransferase
MLNFISAIDFYKSGHKYQMEPGTSHLYEGWTPRATRVEDCSFVIAVGLQAALHYDFGILAKETFFDQPKKKILDSYQRRMDRSIGPGLDIRHIGDLHELGYLPLEFWALPEGTRVPHKVPIFTVENTHPDFAWLPGYAEDLLSSRLWIPSTTAATAYQYKQMFTNWARLTGGNANFVPFQAHDFSFRGHTSPESAAMSGLGHLVFFDGTDMVPSLDIIDDIYAGDAQYGKSIPATEHMVMCLGGKNHEFETYQRLLDQYPSGHIGIVSDTWHLWNVIENYLPRLKPQIMNRAGTLVLRPDSGNPVHILTGDDREKRDYRVRQGVVELLWNQFPGSWNHKQFKEVDSHISCIYGDSITLDRGNKICQRLANKGFASTNWVAGVGSYTYQYVTRDTHGFALKATWARNKGEERFMSKDPITDDGVKRSASGRMAVISEDGPLKLVDGLYEEEQRNYKGNHLQPVWKDSKFLRKTTWGGIKLRAFIP